MRGCLEKYRARFVCRAEQKVMSKQFGTDDAVESCHFLILLLKICIYS